MKVLFKYPTRSRPNEFLNQLDRYKNCLDRSLPYQFYVSCDKDDLTMNNTEMIRRISSFDGNLGCFFGDNHSKIQAVNADMDKVDYDWDILFLISDDMIPKVGHLNSKIARLMKFYFPDTDGVLWLNDGYVGKKLNTLVIIGRKYYERFNYIYHPDYKQFWCDNEFTDVSRILNKYKYIDSVLVEHFHPANNSKAKNDMLYNNAMKTFDSDKQIYLHRKSLNFGL